MSRTDAHRKVRPAPRAPVVHSARPQPPRSRYVEAADDEGDDWGEDWRAIDDLPELDDELAQHALAARGDDDD